MARDHKIGAGSLDVPKCLALLYPGTGMKNTVVNLKCFIALMKTVPKQYTVHTGELAKVFCKICYKSYQSRTSYKAHLKNNQCKPRELDEIPEEELKEIEGELGLEEDEDIEELEPEEEEGEDD